jgi:hypothetical protein
MRARISRRACGATRLTTLVLRLIGSIDSVEPVE